jgi:hypothetical protein
MTRDEFLGTYNIYELANRCKEYTLVIKEG